VDSVFKDYLMGQSAPLRNTLVGPSHSRSTMQALFVMRGGIRVSIVVYQLIKTDSTLSDYQVLTSCGQHNNLCYMQLPMYCTAENQGLHLSHL